MGVNDRFPLVTVGIPFLNPGTAFVDAIRSVFVQTHSNWELILIDDGSTDQSLDLALKIRDSRVRVISDGKHKGLPTRLNEITASASGEYIARMDADDVMHPERLEKQVKFLLSHPSCDVVGTGVFFIDKNGTPVGIRSLEGELPSTLLESRKRPWLVHGTIMAKREWFVENPYNPIYKRSEERELLFRTFTRTTFGMIPEFLYGWRFAGAYTLSKYLSGFYYERKYLRELGPKLLGRTVTLRLVLESYAKSAAATVLFATGLTRIVYRRAYEAISGPEQERYLTKVLNTIRGQAVPGWSSDVRSSVVDQMQHNDAGQ